MSTITSLVSEKPRKTAVAALQGALVDLIDLSLLGKQAHWNVVGRHFRELHLQLDEIVDLARTGSDTVAERAVALGSNPDGRSSAVAGATQLQQVELGYLEDAKVVAAIAGILSSVIGRMRERVEATESEPVTQDLLIGITHDLEKQHWMIQAQR